MNADAGARPTPGLWSMVWKLLRLRLIIQISSFRRAKTRKKFGMIVLGILLLAFLGFIVFISWALLRFLQDPRMAEYIPELASLIDSVPIMIVGGAFLGILITSFGVLLQALYLAGDMDFLLSAPIPIRAVFISKMLQAILPNFSLISLFSLPVLFGLGIARSYNFLYYPLVILVLVALALAAAGVSSLLVMLVVRIFPARRIAEVLGFVGAVLSFICSQSGQLAQYSNVSEDQATQALQLLSRFNQPWSPLTWAGRGLMDLGSERWLTALLYLGLTLGLASIAFYGALTTAEKLYYSGWASMQGIKRKKKAPRPTHTVQPRSVPTGLAPVAMLIAPIQRLIPSDVRAIIWKDSLVLRRDLRNMSQLVTPLILGIIYAFMFLRSGSEPPPGQGEAPAWVMEAMKNLLVYGNVGISLFVGWVLLGRLAGMGFSQEGKHYWLLKSAPISTGRLIAAKFLVAYLPVLCLGWLFLIVISLLQRASLGVLLFSLPVVALNIAGNAGLNLAFGIAGANMAWENPQQMQRGSTGCLSAIAVMLYLPLSLGLFFGPGILFVALGLSGTLGQALGLVIGGAFSLLCAILPLWLVRNRVPKLAE
ncbi:MAG: hypothetical protein JXB15_01960 [Anaerolineales bacterium]|nr:hypothetical protein [Anaerolineales bacterium]